MTGSDEPPRKIRRRPKGEATRRALMEAAFRVFEAKGFLRTQISDIAREAGKSNGVVYIYFRNKDEILDAWLEVCDATVAWYHTDTSLLFDKARGFILESYWALYERYGPVVEALEAAALVSDHFRERRMQLEHQGHQSIARMIRHAQAQGRCGDIDPELTAVSIATLISQTAAYWFANRKTLEARGFDRESAMANLQTLYERMLTSEGLDQKQSPVPAEHQTRRASGT